MMPSFLPWGVALLGATTVLAQSPPTCSLSQKCPKEAPCCSQYGQCGIGAYCLGGCDPRMSFSLDSCVPAPVCQNKKFSMSSMDGIVDVTKYLGDPKTADWVAQGEPVAYNGNVLLTMPPRSVGTVLASTVYMWYGSVKAKLKTARGRGVVTAFILLSDVKDEIDYEFVGVDLETAQTNYYFQGIPKYDNSGNISLSDTFNNFHEYEIRWTPDEITWLVDGQVGRVKKRSETWNASANQWDFPQTPSRVQLSIWPGGADTNAAGTIAWAGGPIDWNGEDIRNNGYYYTTFGEIEINCFNAPSPPGSNKGVSYSFNNVKATNDSVIDGDKPTILKSFMGTGLDMNAGDSTNSADNPSATHAQIPGGGNVGPGQNPGGAATASGGDSGDGSATSPNSCSAMSFSQNCGTIGNQNEAARPHERLLGASALAVVVALAGALWL